MPFMVIYTTSDGASCHEQADAIDEAALFVERLRNKDGIEKVRIYRMEEISFSFRPYYKVELGCRSNNGTADHCADLQRDRVGPSTARVPTRPRVVDGPDPVVEVVQWMLRSPRPRPPRCRRPTARRRRRRSCRRQCTSRPVRTLNLLGSPQRLIEQRRHRQCEQADHRGRAHPSAVSRSASSTPERTRTHQGRTSRSATSLTSTCAASQPTTEPRLIADHAVRRCYRSPHDPSWPRPLRRWCAAAGVAAGSRSWWWSSCWGSRCSEPRSFPCRT